MCWYDGQHSPVSLALSANLLRTSFLNGFPTLMLMALAISSMLMLPSPARYTRKRGTQMCGRQYQIAAQ
ncbi:hypothetical protein O23A_p1187 [Aeromonas salmonicida]|nr:hypothetical protein O23A_p1187 [Aeromonas salmonicida]